MADIAIFIAEILKNAIINDINTNIVVDIDNLRYDNTSMLLMQIINIDTK